MQKHIYAFMVPCLLIAGVCTNSYAQRVGVLTPNPQAPFHVASSGQVYIDGGLAVFGDTSEGHLQLDIDVLQTMYGDTPNQLRLQPDGGNLGVGSNLMFLNASNGFMGIGTTTPDQKLEIEGSADQFMRVHTTSAGSSVAGLELLRSSEFSGTDWRILNEGGTLRIYDGLDNFLTSGDLNMTMTSSGGLGLGIDPPESHLHVAGTTDQIIKVHRMTAGSGLAGIDFLRDVGNSGTDYRIVNSGGVLQFRDNIDNFATEGDINMVMTASGNVGIGTENPNSPMHIIGTESIDGTTGDGYFQLGDPAGQHVRFDNNEILGKDGDAAGFLYLQYWGGNLFLTDNNAGRVGIGNVSPAAKVHITDGTDVSLGSGGEIVLGPISGENIAMDGDEMQARNNSAAAPLHMQVSGGNLLVCDATAGRLGVGTTAPAAKVHVTDGTDVSLAGGGELVLGPTSGLNVGMDGNEIQARSNGAISPLNIQAEGGDLLLIPFGGGQVGIGIQSPLTMPSDDYLFAVDGKIISEEVRVELSGSWPDYVFEEDYKLTPLNELEQKIETLGHLPGIPSAENVENDGILLGDMQRAMMEKIEELTLYVIDLQKQIEDLKKDK